MRPQDFTIRNIPPECIEHIREKEALRLKAYPDPIGVPSIGYGHTGGVTKADISNGRTITKAEAESLLLQDIEEACQILRNSVTVDLTPHQLGALTSFVYNVGHGRKKTANDPGKDGFVVLKNGQPSTMRRKLNENDFNGAAAEFSRWVYAGGKRFSGLVTRRAEETSMFYKTVIATPVAPTAPEPSPDPVKPAPTPSPTPPQEKPPLTDQTSSWPTRKVLAGGIVGALTFIFVVFWNTQFPADPISAEHATAVASALVFLVQYIVRNRATDIPPDGEPKA